MSITLKSAVKIVTGAAAVINGRFPIKWEDIINKPLIPDIDISDLYTKAEVNNLMEKSKQLVSPDGSVWKPVIDDTGLVVWKKVTVDGN